MITQPRSCGHVTDWIARPGLAVVVLLAISSAPARAVELPRYKLKVGQELVYRSNDPAKESDDGKGNQSSSKITVEWTIDVIGQNSDGSWQLLFRQNRTSTHLLNGKETTRDNTTNGYFDLASDGKTTENPTLQPTADPTVLFPPLPPDAASLGGSWSTTVGFSNTRRNLKATSGPSEPFDEWAIVEDPQTVFDPVYLLTAHREYVFDLKQGLVRKAATTHKQGWPAGRADAVVTQTIELVGTRQLEDAEVAALRDETTRYFATYSRYDKLMDRANEDFAHAHELLDKAEAELTKVDNQFKVPAVRTMLEDAVKRHASTSKYTLEDAERFGKLLNQPSDDWKTTDLDDQPRSLEDYRGKVVLLDFWYRGCPWCIRSMPQLKQLADEFPKDKFVLLGMNSDRKLDDARFVIDKMQLNYVSLKNGSSQDGIHTKYGIHGWPTLVILDGKGIIRNIHVGYSPNLRQELGEKIRELLAESAN